MSPGIEPSWWLRGKLAHLQALEFEYEKSSLPGTRATRIALKQVFPNKSSQMRLFRESVSSGNVRKDLVPGWVSLCSGHLAPACFSFYRAQLARHASPSKSGC